MKPQENNKIEDILNSLDGTQRATTPAYFYTRLKARMLARQTGGEKGIETKSSRPWILRPAYAFAALVLVILINAAVIFQGQDSTENSGIDTSETYQSIAAEYNLNDSITEEVYK